MIVRIDQALPSPLPFLPIPSPDFGALLNRLQLSANQRADQTFPGDGTNHATQHGETVQDAVAIVQEAVDARQRAEALRESLGNPSSWGSMDSETIRYELESSIALLEAEAAGKEAEARTLLLPGFLEAAFPVAADAEALGEVLGIHAAPITDVGAGQPGFAEIVDGAREDARAILDEIFGPLREPIAAAQASSDWDGVRDAAIAQFDALAADGPDHEAAVRNLADIMITGAPTPGATVGEDPYATAIDEAARQVLVERPLQEVRDARPDEAPSAYDDYQIPSDLAKLEEVTRDVSPELAARILTAAADEGIIAEVIEGRPDEEGRGLPDYHHDKSDTIVETLVVLADRTTPEDGTEFIDAVVDSFLRVSEDDDVDLSRGLPWPTRYFSESSGLVRRLGESLRDATANGQSPAVAIALADRLTASGRQGEAGDLLDLTAEGIEQLQNNATAKGEQFKSDVLYVDQVARPNLRPEEADRGLQVLLEDQQDLVEDLDRYGKATIRTLEALEQAPQHLLDSSGRLVEARNDLEGAAEDEQGGLLLTVQFSPSAAMDLLRIGEEVQDEAQRELLQTMPDSDLDALLEELGRLPTDDPFVVLVEALGTGEPARTTLRNDPRLTLALFQHVSDDTETSGDDGEPVPSPPDPGFLSRTGRDVVFQIFEYQRPNGGGMLPGISPLQPTPEAERAASQQQARQQMRQALAPGNTGGGYHYLSQFTRSTWLKLYPMQTIEARPGVATRPIAGPLAYGGSMVLNAWGADVWLQSDAPLDKAFGGFLALGAGIDAARLASPSFRQISGLRGWEWLPQVYNHGFTALGAAYMVSEFAQGDVSMGLAWAPAVGTSIYAMLPGAAAGGPVSAVGWLVTAAALHGIGQYRRVEASNHHEPLFGTYLEAARPDVDKARSLANCDENGIPYLALQPAFAEHLGVEPTAITDWLYDLPTGERDTFIDRALQVKPDDDGNYPIERAPDKSVGRWSRGPSDTSDPRIQRSQVDTLEDIELFAEHYGYQLPTG